MDEKLRTKVLAEPFVGRTKTAGIGSLTTVASEVSIAPIKEVEDLRCLNALLIIILPASGLQ